MSSSSPPYHYPVKNVDIIRHHGLDSHFEGGFYRQTLALASVPPHTKDPRPRLAGPDGPRVQNASGTASELLVGQQDANAQDTNEATCIYYLITPDSSRGRMHMNDYATFHLHHAGRALYTLIQPTADIPIVRRVVMGANISKGEVTQLFVPGGWWKASEIPDEDMLLLDSPCTHDLRERLGCLISEVVVPGWNVDQHQFLTKQKLEALWRGADGWQVFTPYVEGVKA